MAKASVVRQETVYSLELTEKEAKILYALLGAMHSHNETSIGIYRALTSAGLNYDGRSIGSLTVGPQDV